MESLATELFDTIFTAFTERSELLTLRAVNKSFYVKFTPLAFKGMSFCNTNTSATRFTRVSTSSIAEWVMDLTLDLYVNPDEFHPVAEFECHGIPRTDLAAFTTIRSILVRFPGWHRSRDFKHRVRNRAMTAFASSAMALKSLTIIGMRCGCDQQYTDSPGFGRFVHRLTYLSLEVNTCNTFLPSLLRPAAQSLETLVLNAICKGPELPTAVEFRKLRKLELNDFRFTQSKQDSVETFILSTCVSSTLQELILTNCIFEVEREPAVKRMWADIFQSFQSNLHRLERFTVTGLSYLNIDYGVYAVHQYTSRGIVQHRRNTLSPTEAEHSTDVVALNELWESIGAKERMQPGDEQYLVLTCNENSTLSVDMNLEHEDSGTAFDRILGMECLDVTALEVALHGLDVEE